MPTQFKLVAGAQKCRINESEPVRKKGIPNCPRFLDKYAKTEWRRISRLLLGLGILSQLDMAALAAYCQLYSRWRKAEEELAGSGFLIKTTSGNVIQNPLVGIANTALREMMKVLVEFGMTPSSISRLHVEKPKDSLEDILK